jgi:hypothetical protein
MYQSSIPLLVRGLDNLSAVLKKGAAHPDAAALVDARLASDMFTLTGQVQRASDTAKGCAARLAGIDNPSFPDTEASFAQLQERIARTIDVLQGVKPAQIDSSGQADRVQGRPPTCSISPARAISRRSFCRASDSRDHRLRHPAAQGVQVGKMDYLGTMPMQPA